MDRSTFSFMFYELTNKQYQKDRYVAIYLDSIANQSVKISDGC